jgi:hypothetical protein
VTHGGISDITDLNKINQLKRNKVGISSEIDLIEEKKTILFLVYFDFKSKFYYPGK